MKILILKIFRCMFKDCTSTTDEVNAETRSRRDAEKIENLLAAQVIDAAIEVHRAQVLTYLRLTRLKLGLLRDGIERVVNDL